MFVGSRNGRHILNLSLAAAAATAAPSSSTTTRSAPSSSLRTLSTADRSTKTNQQEWAIRNKSMEKRKRAQAGAEGSRTHQSRREGVGERPRISSDRTFSRRIRPSSPQSYESRQSSRSESIGKERDPVPQEWYESPTDRHRSPSQQGSGAPRQEPSDSPGKQRHGSSKRKRPETPRGRRFDFSTQLRSLGRNGGESQVEEATSLWESTTNYVKWNTITCNQYMDVLVGSGKMQKATQLYLDMKKRGCCPTPRTWSILFRGALAKQLTPELHTSLITRVDNAFADMERFRRAALGKREDDVGSDSPVPRPKDTKNRDKLGRAIEEVRRRPSMLSLPYSRYIQLLAVLGRFGDAADLVSRFSDTWHANIDGFPRLTCDILDRWLFVYADYTTQLKQDDIERILELWSAYTRLMYASADGVLQSYDRARYKDRKDDIVAEWKATVPQPKLLYTFAKVAIHSKDSRLCRAAFEAFRDHTDAYEATAFEMKQTVSLPEAMYDHRHPLCIKVAAENQEPSHTGELSEKISDFKVFGYTRALAAYSPDITRSHVFYDRWQRDAKKALESFQGTASSDTRKLQQGALRETNELVTSNSMLNDTIDAISTSVTDDVAKTMMSVISTARQLHQVGLRHEPPDECHYAVAAARLGSADAQIHQVGLWWLQDRAQIPKQVGSPWNRWCLMLAKYVTRSLLKRVVPYSQTRIGNLAINADQNSDDKDGKISSETSFASDFENLALDSEGEVREDEHAAVEHAAARLYLREDGSGSGQSTPSRVERPAVTVENRALVLDFLRKWTATFAPDFKRISSNDDLNHAGGRISSSSLPTSSDGRESSSSHEKGSQPSIDDLFPSPTIFADEVSRGRHLKSRPQDLSHVTYNMIRLLNIALDSGPQGIDLLAKEEVHWLKQFKRRVLVVRDELEKLGIERSFPPSRTDGPGSTSRSSSGRSRREREVTKEGNSSVESHEAGTGEEAKLKLMRATTS